MLTLVVRMMMAVHSGNGLRIAHAKHSPIGIHYHRSGVGVGKLTKSLSGEGTAASLLNFGTIFFFVVPFTELVRLSFDCTNVPVRVDQAL